jgi:DNA-binding Lrp family transcriptional regulator
MTFSNQDLLLLTELRKDARVKLTKLSKDINMPVSTIFERLRTFEEKVLRKNVALIDFGALGYNVRVNICMQSDRDGRLLLTTFLKCHQNINSLFKINNGYDLMAEAVFKDLKEVEDFMELLETKFRIKKKQLFYILDEITKETFLSRPEYLEILQIDTSGKTYPFSKNHQVA